MGDVIDRSIPVGAVPPPPGVTPDFAHPRDAGWTANVAAMIVFDLVSTIFFTVRTYVKVTSAPRIWVEDWTCLVAWILILSYTGTVYAMAHYGEGYHAWELTMDEYLNVKKWLYASSILYCPAAYFTMLTLLLLIARVFAVQANFTRAIRIFILFMTLAYTPVHIIKTFICSPIRKYWDPSADGFCLNQPHVFLVDLGLGACTDLVILLAPIPLVWSLRVSTLKKLKIVVLLGAGGGATAVGLWRMYAVVQFEKSTDVTAEFVILSIGTALELVIGLICACLPALNILIERRWGGPSRERFSPRVSSDRWTRKFKSYYHSYLRRESEQNRVAHVEHVENTSPDEIQLTGAETGTARARTTNGDLKSRGTSEGPSQGQHGYRTSFDVERAMRTGKPVSVRTDSLERAYGLGSVAPAGADLEMDGEHDGWLSADHKDEETGESSSRVEGRGGGLEKDPNAVLNGNVRSPEGMIWDGRRKASDRQGNG